MIPCAYLHNYSPEYRSTLSNSIYEEWVSEAPFFLKNEVVEFAAFVKKFITKKSSRGDLLYLIDHGRIRPSKSLQDSLVSMVKGNDEFLLLDEQVVCFDMCLKMMSRCQLDRKKRTIILCDKESRSKRCVPIIVDKRQS